MQMKAGASPRQRTEVTARWFKMFSVQAQAVRLSAASTGEDGYLRLCVDIFIIIMPS
jgi:hypothetical protein